jgi:hypothetical protein
MHHAVAVLDAFRRRRAYLYDGSGLLARARLVPFAWAWACRSPPRRQLVGMDTMQKSSKPLTNSSTRFGARWHDGAVDG